MVKKTLRDFAALHRHGVRRSHLHHRCIDMITAEREGTMFARSAMYGLIKRTLVAVVLTITQLVINDARLHPQAMNCVGACRLIENCALAGSVHLDLSEQKVAQRSFQSSTLNIGSCKCCI